MRLALRGKFNTREIILCSRYYGRDCGKIVTGTKIFCGSKNR